jgi:hypothetical protein
MQRRRFTQTAPFGQRLEEQAKRLRQARKGRGIRGLLFMQTPMDGRYPSRGAALPGLEAGSNHPAAMSSHCANTLEIKENSSRTATPRRMSTIGLRFNTEAVHCFCSNRLMRQARVRTH